MHAQDDAGVGPAPEQSPGKTDLPDSNGTASSVRKSLLKHPMRTHKSATYVRVKSDKKRPLKVIRPTLREIEVLRRIRNRLRAKLNESAKA